MNPPDDATEEELAQGLQWVYFKCSFCTARNEFMVDEDFFEKHQMVSQEFKDQIAYEEDRKAKKKVKERVSDDNQKKPASKSAVSQIQADDKMNRSVSDGSKPSLMSRISSKLKGSSKKVDHNAVLDDEQDFNDDLPPPAYHQSIALAPPKH
jgi:hypothetical protein